MVHKKVRNTKWIGNDTFAFLEKKKARGCRDEKRGAGIEKKEIKENARQRESMIEEQRRLDWEGFCGRNLGRRLDLIEQQLQQIMLQMLQNQQHHSQMLTEILRRLEKNN